MPRTLSESEISAFRIKLCETAEHLFAEFGIDGFTMRRLASALGVSAMTPYRYYRNKSELLAAVRTHAFLQLAETLQNIPQRPPEGRQTDSLCHAYLNFARQYPDPYQLMFSHSDDTAGMPASLEQAYQKCLDSFAYALDADLGSAPGVSAPGKLAFAYWSMLHGAIVISQMLGKDKNTELSNLVIKASHSFLHGWRNSDDCRQTATQSRSDEEKQLQKDPETV